MPGTGLHWSDPDGAPVTPTDWDAAWGHSFAVVFPGTLPAPSVLVMLNAYWDAVVFTLPGSPTGTWTVVLDTAPEDGVPVPTAPLAQGASLSLGGRSMVVARS